jgi:hypothetical protein
MFENKSNCSCPEVRVPRRAILDGEAAITHTGAGLILINENHQILERIDERAFGKGAPLSGRRERRAVSLYWHEYVHYVQNLGSYYLQDLHIQRYEAARDLVAFGPHRERLHVFEHLGVMLAEPKSEGWSCLDLLESAAVLGQYNIGAQLAGKSIASKAARVAFPTELDTYRSPSRRRYWAAFDFLTGVIGFDAAYELFLPLCLAAFNTTNPPENFLKFARMLGGRKGWIRRQTLRKLPVWQLLMYCGVKDMSWINDGIQTFTRDFREAPITIAVRRLAGYLQPEELIEFLGRPWIVHRLANRPEVWDLFHPPVVVYSSTDEHIKLRLAGLTPEGGLQTVHREVLTEVGVIGAVEIAVDKMHQRGDRPYNYCVHTRCPYFEGALCHRWYYAPPMSLHHDNCQFPRVFEEDTGVSLSEFYRVGGFPMNGH